MPRLPSIHRKDTNHDAVVEIAEAYGWQVVPLTSAGGGIPDLLVWKHPQGFRLVEVKHGKAGRLTEAQQRFQQRYTFPVFYISTLQSAHAFFGCFAALQRNDGATIEASD